MFVETWHERRSKEGQLRAELLLALSHGTLLTLVIVGSESDSWLRKPLEKICFSLFFFCFTNWCVHEATTTSPNVKQWHVVAVALTVNSDVRHGVHRNKLTVTYRNIMLHLSISFSPILSWKSASCPLSKLPQKWHHLLIKHPFKGFASYNSWLYRSVMCHY